MAWRWENKGNIVRYMGEVREIKTKSKLLWCGTYKNFGALSSKMCGRSLESGTNYSRLTNTNQDRQSFRRCKMYFLEIILSRPSTFLFPQSWKSLLQITVTISVLYLILVSAHLPPPWPLGLLSSVPHSRPIICPSRSSSASYKGDPYLLHRWNSLPSFSRKYLSIGKHQLETRRRTEC